MSDQLANKTGHKLLKSYLMGFVLSAIFMLLAFAIVIKKLLTVKYLYISLTVLVILQLFIQVRCFFRLYDNTEDREWNLITLVFTILVAAVIVVGSLWIMYNLNYNMMP